MVGSKFAHRDPTPGDQSWTREHDEEKGRRTQTLKFRFLYVTDSTLNPIVGIVVTTSPIYTQSVLMLVFSLGLGDGPSTGRAMWSCRHYPTRCGLVLIVEEAGKDANTKPRISILISFFANINPDNHDMLAPILLDRSWAGLSVLPFLSQRMPLLRTVVLTP